MAQLRRLRRVFPDHRDHLDQPPRHAATPSWRRPHDPRTQPAAPINNRIPALLHRADGRLPEGNQRSKVAAVVYGGSFLALSIAFFAIHQHMLRAKQHLLRERLKPAASRQMLRRNAVGLLPYTIATIGAVLTPYLTLAICAGVATYYALPSTSIEQQPPGLQNAADELDADRA